MSDEQKEILGGVSPTEGVTASVLSSDTTAPHAAHTPGPWTITKTNFITYIKADTGHKEIAVMYADSGVDKQANAQLIASAPDMLAALKSAWLVSTHVCRELGVEHCSRCKVVAAIKKAEG